MKRWRNRKTTSVGTITRTAPAEMCTISFSTTSTRSLTFLTSVTWVRTRPGGDESHSAGT